MIVQLKKGILEFCILLIISKDELYGYEIMKKITGIFSDTREATVYTILRRLLHEGYTECFSKDISNGPPRKYYRITMEGNAYLEQCKKDWFFVQGAVSEVMQN